MRAQRQWRWIKRCQAVKLVIGYLNNDCRFRRCRFKGALADALHVFCCAARCKLHWLLQWMALLHAWLDTMVRVSLSALSKSPGATGAWTEFFSGD